MIRDGIIFIVIMSFLSEPSDANSVCDIGYYPPLKCKAALCNDRNLKDVPAVMDHVELLSLSYNNIFQLTDKSFSQYTKLKYLYLAKNGLGKIDDRTFAPLTKLIILDLRENSILVLPAYLPSSLEDLNLAYNPLLFDGGKEPKLPELDSLKKLSLSLNFIKTFPKFVGSIHSLEFINLTDNAIKTFTTEDLAPLCRLKTLHMNTLELFRMPNMSCDCLRVQEWIKSRGISIPGFACRKEIDENFQCDLRPSSESLLAESNCESKLFKKDLLRKVTYGGGILIALILLVILLYICCCRKKFRSKNKAVNNAHVIRFQQNIKNRPESVFV